MLNWLPLSDSRDPAVIAAGQEVFSPSGGLKLLSGNLGRAVIKVSAVVVVLEVDFASMAERCS